MIGFTGLPLDAVRVLVPVLDRDTGGEHYVALDFDALEPVAASDRDVVSGNRRLGEFSSPALAASLAGRLERRGARRPSCRGRRAPRESLVAAGSRGPMAPDDAAGAAALSWFQERSAALARRAVVDAGLDPDVLLAPPAAGPDVHSYCPGCGRQFAAEEADCEACGLRAVTLP